MNANRKPRDTIEQTGLRFAFAQCRAATERRRGALNDGDPSLPLRCECETQTVRTTTEWLAGPRPGP